MPRRHDAEGARSPVFDADAFDAETLAAVKGAQRLSVCLPAHNEARTIGTIVHTIRQALVEAVPLVDEILVVDDASSDGTAAVAEAAGARVEAAAAILPSEGTRRGKGEALWKSVAACDGDLIVWLDADLIDFDPRFVTGLVGPLLAEPGIVFVKGFYERPGADGDLGGGRVTELVARPLLSTWFPELAEIVQPIGGEYASRREIVERVPFAGGYGVDIGLLIDIVKGWGIDAVAQVDLGVRNHRNRPLHQLGPQALAVLAAALRRAGIDVPDTPVLRKPDGLSVSIDVSDRPPLVHVPAYRAETATVLHSLPAGAAAGDRRLAELAAALAEMSEEEAAEAIAGTSGDPLERIARAIVRHRRSGSGEV